MSWFRRKPRARFYIAAHIRIGHLTQLQVSHYVDILDFKRATEELGVHIAAGRVLAWDSGVVP